jgi:hypothetical protein
METLLQTIEWMPVLVSFLVTFVLGWIWYADIGFGKKWREGKGAEVVQHPMWMPMSAQAGATLFFAIVINIFMVYDNVAMAILVALTIAGFIKSNGLFAGKTKWSISVDTLYILAMATVMIGVNMVM